MKKILLSLSLLFSIAFSDNVKELSLACQSYEDIINVKKIQNTIKNGEIPKNCLFLTSNANISVLDDKLKDKKIAKILILDLNTYMYILKEDVIVTNKNKI